MAADAHAAPAAASGHAAKKSFGATVSEALKNGWIVIGALGVVAVMIIVGGVFLHMAHENANQVIFTEVADMRQTKAGLRQYIVELAPVIAFVLITLGLLVGGTVLAIKIMQIPSKALNPGQADHH